MKICYNKLEYERGIVLVMMKKIFAFTLSEILIALSVIGVVAVLVMPQLVAGQKAAKAKAQFNTAYVLMAKAITDMDADDVSIDPIKYPTRTFYEKFKPYNKVAVDCGFSEQSTNKNVCPGSGGKVYHVLSSNGTAASDLLDDGAFVLNNGMLVAIENCKNCGYGEDHNIWLVVDVNGRDYMPNKVGYDLFVFQVTKDGLLPLGAPGTDKKFSTNPEKYCCTQSINPGCSAGESQYNGYTCAFFASTDEDYFKRVYNGH